MDKYEYRLKTEHIQQIALKRQYQEAASLCDTIDWTRVRDVNMLQIVAEVYTKVRRYQDAISVLEQAYRNSPLGRRIVYRLVELGLQSGSYELASRYFDEFCRIAPHDPSRYILLYIWCKCIYVVTGRWKGRFRNLMIFSHSAVKFIMAYSASFLDIIFPIKCNVKWNNFYIIACGVFGK